MVRNYRVRGKHRQEVICHIGPHDSLKAAIEHTEDKASEKTRMAAHLRGYAKHLEARFKNHRAEFGSELSQ